MIGSCGSILTCGIMYMHSLGWVTLCSVVGSCSSVQSHTSPQIYGQEGTFPLGH